MRQFGYLNVTELAAALTALTEYPAAELLGGGTNLVDLMKLGVHQPATLIDVSGLPLRQIQAQSDGSLLIGGAVRNSDLAADLSVRQGYPAVAQAVLAGASGQLRNQATVAGNLMQRTRCPYFMDPTKPCNKRDPGSGCPARTGEHHNHAILGASPSCIATGPSDLAVALAAFDAEVIVLTVDGEQAVPIGQFRTLPGDRPEIETSVAGLVTGVRLPAAPLAAGGVYRKVRERASYAFAIASVAAALSVQDGHIAGGRIAWGAVAAIPWRAHRAEAYLQGRPADPDTFRAAVELELAEAVPLPDNAYKIKMIGNLTVDVLSELAR